MNTNSMHTSVSRLKASLLLSLTALLLATAQKSFAAPAAPAAPASPAGTVRLFDGNARYSTSKLQHPRQDRQRREEVAQGQKPFAVVVSCSDSRVPPEVVFDQGLGDLFVVRTAGHVVDSVALGSIEFAVAKLGARSIVVLGHERCGAVQASLERTQVPGSIGSITAAITPGIASVTGKDSAALDQAIALNVQSVVSRIHKASPVLAPYFADGSLELSGAVYDLDTGKVTRVEGGTGK